MADFADYLKTQEDVSIAWANRKEWNRMSLLNTARSGFFSSDRSIREYCESIWSVLIFVGGVAWDIEEVTT
jgi:starch phosphorylase